MLGLRTGGTIIRPYVATTNYDLCFEAFCSISALNYTNGFSHHRAEHEFDFDPSLFDRVDGVPLLKLHGSIDWWKTKSGRVVETQHGSVGNRLRNGDEVSELCIRYPISDKQLFEYPFVELYSRLGRYLRDSDVWLFIGYRFADPSVRNLVMNLAQPGKKIVAVGPTASQILQNELRLSERIPSYAIPIKFPHKDCVDAIIRAFGDTPDGYRPRLQVF